ncbi:MAG: hypothetical protein IJV85_00100 [Clostridia bacterium]|nr:hypothetical protein [Clostridia bacterium]
MSNNKKPVEYEAVEEMMPEALPEQPEVALEEPQSKNIAARLFAILFAIVSVAGLFLPLTVCMGDGKVAEMSLFSVLTKSFSSNVKIFGVIPSYLPEQVTYAMLAIYLTIVFVLLAAVFGILALIIGKKAPCFLRTTLFFLMAAYGNYAVSVYVNVQQFELLSLAITAIALFVYFILSVKKLGKQGFAKSIQALLSLVVSAVLVYGILSAGDNTKAFKLGLAEVVASLNYYYALYAIVGLSLINIAIGVIRMQKEEGYVCDLVRYVVEFIVALLVFYVAFSVPEAAKVQHNLTLFTLIAAAVALVQIIFGTILLIRSRKVVVEEEPVEEEDPDEGFVLEEYAEAYPYVGGAVDGIEMAQEVNPSFLPHSPHVSTAGYDFYNSKSFDPFIAILNTEERNQFTELFILKYKGTMPELPDYVVGGDNTEFFRKIFIYLGQYRDRLPDSLLAKMYKYSIRL